MNRVTDRRILTIAVFASGFAMLAFRPVSAGDDVTTGRYLVTIAGCNDCHTHNWTASRGEVAEEDWLTGSVIGWRGSWGTSYASNLRLVVDAMPEDAWVAMLKTRTDRPPMPWMNVNQLSDADSRAIYRYIRSLGPRGERVPAAVDAGDEPVTPYFLFKPVVPGAAKQASAAKRP